MNYLMYNIIRFKESMQITNILSSKDTIIKQEIYLQMIAYDKFVVLQIILIHKLIIQIRNLVLFAFLKNLK